MTPAAFVEKLAAVRLDAAWVFNPYSDCCLKHDQPNAPELRRENLTVTLEAAVRLGVDSVWVGREPGHLGARRTGLALTDDDTLRCASEMFGVQLQKATHSVVRRENTAQAIWEILPKLDCRVFPWNVFPLHSHNMGNPLSNRKHCATERAEGVEFLRDILGMLKPNRVVAVGCDAKRALRKMKVDARSCFVNHPARERERKKFPGQVGEIYGVKFDSDWRRIIPL